MARAGYSASHPGHISDYYKKMAQIENEQWKYVNEDSGPRYHVWKFSRGDVAVMLIGGILGGIFSSLVMQIFFK